MSGLFIDYAQARDRILAALGSENDANAAMQLVVSELARLIPHYDWVGIYMLVGDTLVLGPYRGEPSPHARIPIGEGICGAAASAKKTIIVPDVNADPRYLACSIKTKSELVVPIMDGPVCLGEIDIDSFTPDAFSELDQGLVEQIAAVLAQKLDRWKYPPK